MNQGARTATTTPLTDRPSNNVKGRGDFLQVPETSLPRTLESYTTEMANASDPFDDVQNIEETLYISAYSQGQADGAHAGRIEGRIFGLEKGFEKFASMGILHGRACVWAARTSGENGETTSSSENAQEKPILPTLPSNARLDKNISLLHGLTDTLTFSTENNEESVADFDDRLKRASAKAKIIERTIGEQDASAPREGSPTKGGSRMKVSGEGKKDDDMESFAGSRLLA